MNTLNNRLVALIVTFVFFSAALLSAINMYFYMQESTYDLLNANTTIAQQMARETEQLMNNIEEV